LIQEGSCCRSCGSKRWSCRIKIICAFQFHELVIVLTSPQELKRRGRRSEDRTSKKNLACLQSLLILDSIYLLFTLAFISD